MAASEFRAIEALAEKAVVDDPSDFRLPTSVVTTLLNGGVSPDELGAIVGLQGAASGSAGSLTSEESDRAARLAHVIALAERVFQSRDKAFVWLRLPSEQLDGRTPIAYLTTETGARFVEEMLVRIDHGIAA